MANKTSIKELSLISGSPPAFSEQIHTNKPSSNNREVFKKYIDNIFDKSWFSNNGPMSIELEKRLKQLLEVKHCALTCNGTNAMLCVILALELKGEVILPAFTFVSTAHLLTILGIKPIFCDIDPVTHNLDIAHCYSLVNSNTSAVISTHLWGRPCNIEGLEELCRTRNIKLIFDAAHAFNNTHKGIKIGRHGDAEIFSFHATKSFHCFEGGAITTQNSDLSSKVKKILNFGFAGFDEVKTIGVNAKMSEVSAAMGLSNLSGLEDTRNHSKQVYDIYKKRLANLKGIKLIQYDCNELANYHYVVISFDYKMIGISRNTLLRILHAENIIARRYFYPGVHKLTPYSQERNILPNTDELCKRVVVLPAGSNIAFDTVEKICGIIKFVTSNARELDNILSHD